MRTIGIVLAASLLVLGVGCQQGVNPAAERTAIRDLERAGINAANQKDVNAWLEVYDANATLLPPNQAVVTGKVAMKAWGMSAFEQPGFALKYENDQTEVSQSGDLGYTIGRYELTLNNPKGDPVVEHGNYFRLFRKQTDGAWKCVADVWNAGPPSADKS